MNKGIKCTVKAITDEDYQHEAIIRFLSIFEDKKETVDYWQANFISWWKKNPFYEEGLPRGWVLEADGKIVGFFGCIVTDYMYEGKIYKALNATTWRVAKEYRKHSMLLFLQFYNSKEKFILCNATPNDIVEKILQLSEFIPNKRLSNAILPLRSRPAGVFSIATLCNIMQKFYGGILPRGDCRFIDLRNGIRFKKPDDRYNRYLVKRKDQSYLQWVLSLNNARKIAGYFNRDNEVSSFIIFDKCEKKGIDLLHVFDYFVGDKDGKEILAIINHICGRAFSLYDTRPARFLLFDCYCSNDIKIKFPFFILNRKKEARSYYSKPKELEAANMLNYVSEGDFGLL